MSVVITGAILFTSGVLLTAYLPHFILLYISYGVITGMINNNIIKSEP